MTVWAGEKRRVCLQSEKTPTVSHWFSLIVTLIIEQYCIYRYGVVVGNGMSGLGLVYSLQYIFY